MIFLCYHGVTSTKSVNVENYSKKHIDKKKFIKQMKLLKRNYKMISIEDIYYHIKNKIPFSKKDVAISFDDGFKNNFTIAAPILNKLKIPAIFYLCPRSINKNEMFWVDQIETCIDKCKKSKIKITSLSLRNFYLDSIKKKISLIKKIKKTCKNLNIKKKNDLIKILKKTTSVKPNIKSSKNYELANWKIIKKTSKNNLFTLGGHSLDHDILTKMNMKELDHNIIKTIEIIKNKTGVNVKHFSYPEGKFNNNVIKYLKKHGIKSAPIATGFKNTHNTNLFKIKRVMVGFEKMKFPFSSFKD